MTDTHFPKPGPPKADRSTDPAKNPARADPQPDNPDQPGEIEDPDIRG